MKKLFQILLMLLLVSTLVACGGSGTDKTEFTVTFNVDGGSTVRSQKVESGKLAVEPDEPEKEDFVFGGWYKEAALTNEFDFATPITANITLYAKWNPDPSIFEGYIATTIRNYRDSFNANLFITVVDGEETTTLEYLYNFIGTDVDSLSLKYKSGSQELEAYVKEGWDYVNIDGEKTKSVVSFETSAAIIAEYGFDGFTGVIFDTLDRSIFNATVIKSDEAGVATLDWVKEDYELITEHLPLDDADAIIEATLRYEAIKENINSIQIKISHANKRVTKIESTWVNKDNVTKKIIIEFRGTDPQTISYPSDLSSYTLRR